jgi:AcrR family transcriptional regulator
MSKKTLYVHFGGKDEIIGAVIDHLGAEIRADADALLRNRALNLAEKLRGFVEGMLERMATLSPRTVRDLQRFAPRLYAKVEEVRGTTLPYVFGRFVEEGQVAGLIRTNLPPGFAIEFFLHAMQGLMHPATLERLRVAPRDVIATGIDLFFGGLLTNAGRKQYEKLFPR